MKLIPYDTNTDNSELAMMISAIPKLCYRHIRIEDHSDCDSFLTGLGGSPPDGIVIAMDGADGMEGVIAAKTLRRDIPVLWFSNDGDFDAQSYRLGCAYFHKKPLSPQILSAALAKCIKQSIYKGEKQCTQ